MSEIEIQDHKTVYVAWTNTDLTEGRGWQVPLAVATLESTALRLGRKGSVQGSDCPVTSVMAVKVGGHWLAPCVIHAPTPADERAQERARQRRSAMDRARAAGLSDEDIRAIQGAAA